MATYVFFPSESKTRESVVMFITPNYNIHNCSFEKKIVKLEKNHDLVLSTQFIAKTNSRVKYRNSKL